MAYANKLWNMLLILRSSYVRFSGNKIHPKIHHIDFVNYCLGISFQLRVFDFVSRTATSHMFSNKDKLYHRCRKVKACKKLFLNNRGFYNWYNNGTVLNSNNFQNHFPMKQKSTFDTKGILNKIAKKLDFFPKYLFKDLWILNWKLLINKLAHSYNQGSTVRVRTCDQKNSRSGQKNFAGPWFIGFLSMKPCPDLVWG